MAEAVPNKNTKVHMYGKRNQMISNTAEEGEICIYNGHAIGRFAARSMRYDTHEACVRCVAAAREGRLSLDINRLLKKERKRALKFWSNVDIRGLDDCWNWNGYVNKKSKQPQFSWRRLHIGTSTQYHPQRVSMWLSWGDLGMCGIKSTCGNRFCCNPFHLIPQNLGVYVDHDTYLEDFDMACQLHTLKQQIQEYMMEQAMEELEKEDQGQEIDVRAEMLVDPRTDFGDRFEAVITDMLKGRHISQTELDDPGLYRDITDNEESDPTQDF